MSNIKTFHYPQTLDETIGILKSNPAASIVAGGTILTLAREMSVESLVDITRIGLAYIKDEKEYIRIGSCTTVQEISKSELLKRFAGGILAKAAGSIASRPLRNQITLGGEIAGLRAWSDMPVALLALDAKIKINGSTERIIEAKDFFSDFPKRSLAKEDVITEIIIEKPDKAPQAEYIKFAKTEGDYAIATVACVLKMDGGICKDAKIVIGAVSNLPQRCLQAEEILSGKAITAELIKEAAKACRENTKTISNIWGSAEYKSEVIENLTGKIIADCLKSGVK